MFKILLIVIVIAAGVAYWKFAPKKPNLNQINLPSSLSSVDLSALKSWSIDAVTKYFPETASQSVVLGTAAKNDGLNLLIDAARKLSPQDFKTLQQFVCTPTPK